MKAYGLVFRLFIIAFIIMSVVPKGLQAQTVSATYKNDTIRLESTSSEKIDTSVKILIKKNPLFKKAKLKISIDESKSSVDLGKVKLPVKNEYQLDNLKDSTEILYNFSVSRNAKDDKILIFNLEILDSNSKHVALKKGDTSLYVYIKPLIPDSLSNTDRWEFWMFTGTNFDFFDGIKAQEFFFRANTLFKIRGSFYGQLAFYRNRYYTFDSATNRTLLEKRIPVFPNDTIYKYNYGTYNTNIKQTTDPLGVQFDVLFNLTKGSITNNSNFFGTIGFDIGTRTITLENTYSHFDTIHFATSRPDTISSRSDNTLPLPPITSSYKKPFYNFSFGFMWILDEKDINIKGQLTGGFSKVLAPLVLNTRNGIVTYEIRQNPYIQIRLFGTYKKAGLSFGFESFIRRGDFPEFNFTLSKVFDLKNFLNVLTPVTSLRL